MNIIIIGIIVNQVLTPFLTSHTVTANNAIAPNIWLAEPNNGQTLFHVPERANAAAPTIITKVAICWLEKNFDLPSANSCTPNLPSLVAESNVVIKNAEAVNATNVTPTVSGIP